MTERADENGVIENLQSMVNKLTNDKHDLKSGIEEILDVTVVDENYSEALGIIRGIASHLVNGTER